MNDFKIQPIKYKSNITSQMIFTLQTHYKIFLDPRKKFLTHAKNFDPRKNIFDPRSPRKNYDPRKKYFDPRNPHNPRTHVIHAITQPTRFSRLFQKPLSCLKSAFSNQSRSKVQRQNEKKALEFGTKNPLLLK